MAKISAITTGQQSVTATGAITGTLDTSALSGDYNVKLRVAGLAAGQKIMIALEDTAGATPFTDALQVAVFHFVGADQVDGSARSVESWDIPSARFGATNNKLRFNTLSVTSSPTALVDGWLEQ